MKRYPPCIMGTCVVPWTEDYKLDEPLFREEIQQLAKKLTRHLYIFGTAGEGYAVTDSQFEHIARVFLEETTEAKAEAILGIIHLSLPTILERIERGRTWGFRQFQISLPSWGALNDQELKDFFRETCGRFTDCEFMHYNLPRTKRLLTAEEYKSLAETHSNLVATKNTKEDEVFLAELLNKSPQLQHFLGEFGYALMRDRYECGLLISLAATNHARAHVFFNARDKELKKMSKELRQVLKTLMEVVDAKAHMDGVFDKLIYKLHCPEFPLQLLPPYISVNETCFQQYQKTLQTVAPSWCQLTRTSHQ